MGLRACDHYTSSTLVGGKGGAGPSSLHTTLEGPMEDVNATRWMQKVYKVFYMAFNGPCFTVTWTIFKNDFLGGRPNTKSGDRGTPKAHNRRFILSHHA